MNKGNYIQQNDIERTPKEYLTEGLRFSRLDEIFMDSIYSFMLRKGKVGIQEIFNYFGICPINNNSNGLKEILILKFMGKIDVDREDHKWYCVSLL